MTCPLNARTNGKYSPSGSQIIMSSFVTIKTFVISRFAANDLPAPGVPTISPFGFFSFYGQP